jgi:hypothetical protein
MARFSLKKLCTPAKLYLAISAIFLFSAIFYKISALILIVKVIFVGVWTLLLNWLCSKGLGNLAWVIVILPFVFLFLSVCATMDREGLSSPFNPVDPKNECSNENEISPDQKQNCIDTINEFLANDTIKPFFSSDPSYIIPETNFKIPVTLKKLGRTSTHFPTCPDIRIDDYFYRPYRFDGGQGEHGLCVLKDDIKKNCENITSKKDYINCFIEYLSKSNNEIMLIDFSANAAPWQQAANAVPTQQAANAVPTQQAANAVPTQQAANETCQPGTSKINQTYPNSMFVNPPCPKGFSGPSGNPAICTWENWSEPHSKCNIHVPTWEKCTNGQSLYNACIKS